MSPVLVDEIKAGYCPILMLGLWLLLAGLNPLMIAVSVAAPPPFAFACAGGSLPQSGWQLGGGGEGINLQGLAQTHFISEDGAR